MDEISQVLDMFPSVLVRAKIQREEERARRKEAKVKRKRERAGRLREEGWRLRMKAKLLKTFVRNLQDEADLLFDDAQSLEAEAGHNEKVLKFESDLRRLRVCIYEHLQKQLHCEVPELFMKKLRRIRSINVLAKLLISLSDVRSLENAEREIDDAISRLVQTNTTN